MAKKTGILKVLGRQDFTVRPARNAVYDNKGQFVRFEYLTFMDFTGKR